MTGTYDRGSLVFDEVVPVASLKVGDVITYRPPARRRARPPRHAPHLRDHRRPQPARASSAPRATPTTSPTRGRSRSRTRARRASAPASPTSASRSPRSPTAACGCSSIGLPAAADRALEPRRPVARDRRRARRSPRVKRALLALARPRRAGPVRRSAPRARRSSPPARTPDATFSTAADFNTVAVSLTDPGSPLRGTVALAATAASDRGIASVRFQSSPAGASTWTDAVHRQRRARTPATSTRPAVADGLRDVRAVALDTAGYTPHRRPSPSRRIDNTAPATSADRPGHAADRHQDPERDRVRCRLRPRLGRAPVPARRGRVDDDLRGDVLQLRTPAPLADGLYDLRSLATDRAGNTGTSVVSNRRIDNTAPTVAGHALPRRRARHDDADRDVDDGAGTGVSRSVTSPAGLDRRLDRRLHGVRGAVHLHGDTTIARRPLRRARDRHRRRRPLDDLGDLHRAGSTTPRRSAATLTDPGSPLQAP